MIHAVLPLKPSEVPCMRDIVDYWSRRQDECGLSVDWSEAHKRCWCCAGVRRLQRCHITPRSLRGSDDASNRVLLCAECHAEAPNVADPEFMWVWLRARAVPFYGTYWLERGFREYEFIFRMKPFEGLPVTEAMMSALRSALRPCFAQTSAHWGQGRLNAATVAWVIRTIELAAGKEH